MPAVPNQTKDLAWQQQLTPEEAQAITDAMVRQGKTQQEILAELARIGQQKRAQQEQQAQASAAIERARATGQPMIGKLTPGSSVSPTTSSQWQHAQADPVAHRLMFGPIAPGQGGVGGGVFDGASLVIGPGMAPGVLGRGYRALNAADTALSNAVAKTLAGGKASPIAAKLVNKGYQEATGERLSRSGLKTLSELGLLSAAYLNE